MERGPQVIEQVGHYLKDNRLAGGDPPVGDRRGQVGFAAAGWPEQDEPAVGSGGVVLGQGAGAAVPLAARGLGGSPFLDQVVEGEAGQGAEVAQALEARAVFVGLVDAAAGAGKRVPEVRM